MPWISEFMDILLKVTTQQWILDEFGCFATIV